VISAEILKSARPETAKSTWPGIFDVDEAQAGGCPEFWSRYFPGGDPQLVLNTCRRRPNWGLFWDRICPAGGLRFVVSGACGEGVRREGEGDSASGYASGEEGAFAVQVLKEVVKGRLASDDPSFFLRDGPDLVLIWPLRPAGGEALP
jgi:hypothetical protein